MKLTIDMTGKPEDLAERLEKLVELLQGQKEFPDLTLVDAKKEA